MLLLWFFFAEAETVSKRVVAIEWIPSRSHEQVLAAFSATLKEYGEQGAIERLNAMGSDTDLKSAINGLKTSPPDLVLTFGDAVYAAVHARASSLPLVAFFARDAAAQALPGAMSTEPDTALVWQTALKLKPGTKSLGVLFTDGNIANQQLLSALGANKPTADASVVPVKVPAGACRTDSDYEKAIDKAQLEHSLDVLFVPDDPNSGRFGNAICKYAISKQTPVIATKELTGKGCAAALLIDLDILGASAAQRARALWAGTSKSTTENLASHYFATFDKDVMAALGLLVSPSSEQ